MKKLFSAPVLALPREEGTFILDPDASDVAISGIHHQEQEVDGKLKVHPIAYVRKMLNSIERKNGAARPRSWHRSDLLRKFDRTLRDENSTGELTILH